MEVRTGHIESGGELMLLALARDISERVLPEERLRQSQKLEAMGSLAGGIAHDFNNILAPILGFAELVSEKLPSGGQEYAGPRVVLEAARRARDIVSRILLFSRQSEGDYEPLDLRDHLLETAGVVRRALDEGVPAFN